MRLVVQRVLRASVDVDGRTVSAIERGLCVLVGLHRDDTSDDIDYAVRKLLNLRLFAGPEDKPWTANVVDLQLGILSVSQFTLHAAINKGSKPDFRLAQKTEDAKRQYDEWLSKLGQQYAPDKIQDGVFGAMMQVALVNDGPVTIIVDSRDKKQE